MELMHAHRQWAFRPADERFETLDALKEAVKHRKDHAITEVVRFADIKAEEDGDNLRVFAGDRKLGLTQWGFKQLCSEIGVPADFLGELPGKLSAACFNHHRDRLVKDAPNFRQKLLMLDRGEKPPLLRAATGPDYGRIWDLQVVESVEMLNNETGGRFYNPKAINRNYPDGPLEVPSGLYAGQRNCFIFMIDGGSFLDISPRAQINRGFFSWNSEVGQSSYGLATFLHNGVCGNHIVWGASEFEELRIRHGAGAPEAFFEQALPRLRAFMDASERNEVRAIKKAHEKLLPVKDEEKEIKTWLNTKGFTRKEGVAAYSAAHQEEGECRTVWQMIQGLTASARNVEFTDARVDLERRTGKFLVAMTNN